MTRKSLPCSREFSTGFCAELHSCSTCPHILVTQQADLRECFIVNVEIHSSCILPSMLSFSRSVFYSDRLTATVHGLTIFLMHPTFTAYLIFLCYFQPQNINTVNERNYTFCNCSSLVLLRPFYVKMYSMLFFNMSTIRH